MNSRTKFFVLCFSLFLNLLLVFTTILNPHILLWILPVITISSICTLWLWVTMSLKERRTEPLEFCPRCHGVDTEITINSKGFEILHCNDCDKVFIRNLERLI